MKESTSEDIAIIGMTGRFPGAANVDEFWRNLVAGVESISNFTDEELAASGLDVSALRKDPSSVPARGILRNAEWFDAGFFGISAKQAEVTDPQQRVFLEASWEALENAGYDPARFDGPIGVYAGSGDSSYYLNNLRSRPDLVDLVGERVITLGNEKDYLATWVAYKLNLRGPAISVNTACSTSLVAVCQGCQSLLNYQCDLALAGGIWISFPQRRCVHFQEGGILSPDGHCRTFDVRAQGTVSSDGIGIVVLKRRTEAVNDGDHIYAVIKGFGVNNDGAAKVGFTAPSVDGQAEAVATALAEAGFDPATVSYVECHGTATPIGDPIEIAGLTQAFRMGGAGKNFCAVGSVKSNIGHLGAAAGAAGLIKTALALQHKTLPPSLHFSKPNPKIDFANSPFFVNSTLRKWGDVPMPRRAGVSSFGLGGTNAHVALEEAPTRSPSSPSRLLQLVLLSAKSASALDAASANLLTYLKANPSLNLADAAFTLQEGRQVFQHRQMVVCCDVDDAIFALGTRDPKRVITHHRDVDAPSIVFMFPGQGAQHVNMGADLYRTEVVFKEEIDRCSEILLPGLGMDLREVLYPAIDEVEAAEDLLNQTRIAQPALFAIEFALATLWISWGIKPAALIGHSIGEYVAACLAGVYTVEDALALVVRRGHLMQSMPRGAMLAVPMPEDELRKILPTALSLATVNGPLQCVVSGPTANIDAFAAALTASGKPGTLLHTSHAFHSGMMEPIMRPFAECVGGLKRSEPRIPFLSNLTGTWISASEACDPQYWAKHLRHTVRFWDGIKELLQNRDSILLEVGPGKSLSSLSKFLPEQSTGRAIIPSLRHSREQRSDVSCLLTALAQIWLRGVKVNWSGFYAHERRHRIPLPSYPFKRERYWIEDSQHASPKPPPDLRSRKNPDVSDWFYVPSWQRSAPLQPTCIAAQHCKWLIFMDECGLGFSIAARLEQDLQEVIMIRAGSRFESVSDGSFILNPALSEDYDKLIGELRRKRKFPERVAHFWSVTADLSEPLSDTESFPRHRSMGFDSLLFLAQAIYKCGITDAIQINLVSNNVQEVVDRERLCPGKAMLLGPCKVIPQEHQNLICRSIDIVPGERQGEDRQRLIEQLVEEFHAMDSEPVIAYRGRHRWIQRFEHIRLEEPPAGKTKLRERGVYLITGGLGNLGLILAEFLAAHYRARLILMGRSALPQREEWSNWLDKHGLDDDVGQRIRKVQELEKMGAEVMLFSADGADQEQMAAGISNACQRFGEINGVFHHAGIAGRQAAAFVPDTGKAQGDMQFQAKVHGVFVLEEVLRDMKLDFFVLASSLSTVLGGLGASAYAGANHFLDAFALSRNRLGGPQWISVNWDAWKNEKPSASLNIGATITEFSLTPAEGIEAYRRILGGREFSEVIVSTGDLDSRRDMWVKPQPLGRREASKSEATPQSHGRPSDRSNYVEVKNEMERVIANIWQALLGIEDVGIEDNFFDLGGDSLLLLRVQVKIRQALGTNLSLAEMFEHPTISALARHLSQPTVESAGLGAARDRAQLQRAAIAQQRQTMKNS